MLVIEVSNSSPHKDLGVKADLYARSAVPEYWVIDVARGVVHRHVQPSPAVEVLGAPQIRGVERAGVPGAGLVDELDALAPLRLPDPERRPVTVGHDHHPARVADVGRLGEHAPSSLLRLGGGVVGALDADVARPHRPRRHGLGLRPVAGDGVASQGGSSTQTKVPLMPARIRRHDARPAGGVKVLPCRGWPRRRSR
ncbi:MAG: Uma2 family endonuclease [Actinomycetota bacterium]|nr:Uma2 family endonuclease [Actinomycetota bacterium]